ncbi:hypothetical protein EJ06DRAFT_558839 [Trichodelitschia bisporula]|uniref:Uncharacterized protein n=1 Tax=Trichodelitschia bisporula TaxID=703511 RepID=A0A6G1HPT8_9PEZI|nr:hypothetical protein EJ06DRAFT_558839 [Trichodelitschia bisporula]
MTNSDQFAFMQENAAQQPSTAQSAMTGGHGPQNSVVHHQPTGAAQQQMLDDPLATTAAPFGHGFLQYSPPLSVQNAAQQPWPIGVSNMGSQFNGTFYIHPPIPTVQSGVQLLPQSGPYPDIYWLVQPYFTTGFAPLDSSTSFTTADSNNLSSEGSEPLSYGFVDTGTQSGTATDATGFTLEMDVILKAVALGLHNTSKSGTHPPAPHVLPAQPAAQPYQYSFNGLTGYPQQGPSTTGGDASTSLPVPPSIALPAQTNAQPSQGQDNGLKVNTQQGPGTTLVNTSTSRPAPALSAPPSASQAPSRRVRNTNTSRRTPYSRPVASSKGKSRAPQAAARPCNNFPDTTVLQSANAVPACFSELKQQMPNGVDVKNLDENMAHQVQKEWKLADESWDNTRAQKSAIFLRIPGTIGDGPSAWKTVYMEGPSSHQTRCITEAKELMEQAVLGTAQRGHVLTKETKQQCCKVCQVVARTAPHKNLRKAVEEQSSSTLRKGERRDRVPRATQRCTDCDIYICSKCIHIHEKVAKNALTGLGLWESIKEVQETFDWILATTGLEIASPPTTPPGSGTQSAQSLESAEGFDLVAAAQDAGLPPLVETVQQPLGETAQQPLGETFQQPLEEPTQMMFWGGFSVRDF